MHAFAAARTPGTIAQAQWLACDGDKTIWDVELREWQATVSPQEAAWGAQLLETGIQTNNRVSEASKTRFKRRRPFVTDKTLKTVVPRATAMSQSYPSGHVSRAFVEATIMSSLMPARRARYMRLARQMAMGRIYGGVHYPSDTIGGAFEGAMVGAWVVANSGRPTPS
jgi:membrane-associated phospholipid phosphatase